MNKEKFTPGPWWVLHEGSSEVSVQADKTCICSLNYDPRPKKEVKKYLANARLIAAAPELYDALNKQAYYRCVDCLRLTAKTIEDIPLNKEMIECGCPRRRQDCSAFDVWQLLKKVRGGK